MCQLDVVVVTEKVASLRREYVVCRSLLKKKMCTSVLMRILTAWRKTLMFATLYDRSLNWLWQTLASLGSEFMRARKSLTSRNDFNVHAIYIWVKIKFNIFDCKHYLHFTFAAHDVCVTLMALPSSHHLLPGHPYAYVALMHF